jgi:hypothetical protein
LSHISFELLPVRQPLQLIAETSAAKRQLKQQQPHQQQQLLQRKNADLSQQKGARNSMGSCKKKTPAPAGMVATIGT